MKIDHAASFPAGAGRTALLTLLFGSFLAASGCSSSSGGGETETDTESITEPEPSGEPDDVGTPGQTDGTDGTGNPGEGSEVADVAEAVLNGANVSDADRTVWDCGNEGILSFWADGNGSRVLQSAEESFIWESQVDGTITVNGEYSAAFFGIDFSDADNFSASEAGDGSRYVCTRAAPTPVSRPAVLLPGYEVVRGETSGAVGVYTLAVACADGSRVLGGGASQGGFGWYMDDSRPNDEGTGWQAQYAPDIGGGNGDGIGEAWAICASPETSTTIADHEIVRGETVSGQTGTYTVAAVCPDGKRVLGGGASQGAFGWYLDDTRPASDGTGWQAEYSPDIDGGAGGGIGEAWAVCATVTDPDDVLDLEVVRGDTVSGGGATYTASANCPEGKSVLGGGGSQGDFGGYVDDSRPNDGGTGWQVQYTPDIGGGGGGGIGEAWAICAFTE